MSGGADFEPLLRKTPKVVWEERCFRCGGEGHERHRTGRYAGKLKRAPCSWCDGAGVGYVGVIDDLDELVVHV